MTTSEDIHAAVLADIVTRGTLQGHAARQRRGPETTRQGKSIGLEQDLPTRPKQPDEIPAQRTSGHRVGLVRIRDVVPTLKFHRRQLGTAGRFRRHEVRPDRRLE